MKPIQHKARHYGFTIVEVVIAVSIIGILVTIFIVGLTSWRQHTAETEVKSDLYTLVASMEHARNFNNGYPTLLPATYTSSQNVTVTYSSGDATRYCVNAVSKIVGSVRYYIDSSDSQTPRVGTCT